MKQILRSKATFKKAEEHLNKQPTGSIFLHEAFVNNTYGRPLMPNLVNKIKDTFDADKLGLIVVYTEDWKTYEIIDGQHRVEVLRQLYGNDMQIYVYVLENLTLEQRAQYYFDYNVGRKSLTALDKFKARIAYNDSIAITVHELAKANGVLISQLDTKIKNVQFPVLNAINVAEKLYHAGLLGRTLEVLYHAYKDADANMAKEAFGSAIMQNVARVIRTYKTIDLDRLVEVLSKASSRSWNIKMSDADATLKSVGGAIKIVDAYNNRLHESNRLDVAQLLISMSGYANADIARRGKG